MKGVTDPDAAAGRQSGVTEHSDDGGGEGGRADPGNVPSSSPLVPRGAQPCCCGRGAAVGRLTCSSLCGASPAVYKHVLGDML